jgi:hypothetical protein
MSLNPEQFCQLAVKGALGGAKERSRKIDLHTIAPIDRTEEELYSEVEHFAGIKL